ncbi:helix-turn-helix transcriptional regulator [Paenibacillus humicus]|uniref:helix-turn-helix transcriptional regulator n=1 Tax=Paenibacillus humicus TaxID=412861 RepID=UPI003D292A16
MNLIVTSIYKEVIINSKSSLTLNNHDHISLIFLHSSDPLVVVNNNKSYSLESRMWIFDKKVLIKNITSTALTFNVVTFKMNQKKVNKTMLPVEMQLCTDLTYGDIVKIKTELEDIIKSFFPQLANDHHPVSVSNNKIDPRLIIINRFIRENYSKPITLGQLADIVGVNPVYLSNTYSKVFNTTPMKYLQITRMRKAWDLVVSTGLPIHEVAKCVGFFSSSHFGAVFKKVFNISPYKLRNNQLKLCEERATEMSINPRS